MTMTSINIEVGKTYTTRDGQRVTIESETDWSGVYQFQGVDAEGRITWRSSKGRFQRYPHRLDLVREAETP